STDATTRLITNEGSKTSYTTTRGLTFIRRTWLSETMTVNAASRADITSSTPAIVNNRGHAHPIDLRIEPMS
ncbi:hypothetical protein, partial [Rhodococcus qingshengii]|uniref:hypothetical protein n=1 Tax=Rhodococcus qingshengii TaxID=334542 RepID=UPI001BE0FC47